MVRVWIGLVLFTAAAALAQEPPRAPSDEPLLNWDAWRKHRAGVIHPAAMVKPADLERARRNIERYDWAKRYRDGLEKGAEQWEAKLTPEFLSQMIPATTPGDTLFTPCPSCRHTGKPYHPHGQWKWSVQDPEKLTCVVCGAVFPNEKYPESIALHAGYGGGQTLTFCGGEPFRIFSYSGRPSFTGAIRAHKVSFMADLCRRIAEVYALTGKTEHARAARLILLRLAQVYPNWLVHVGYGEYADMDPHVAALRINNLPQDELCPPPATPDRRLHTGYWSAGRARGVGMEAGFVRQMVEAYEFVCEAKDNGQPIFSDEERMKIEKDLLLESTVLLFADKAVNNKSVGNATAVALVGMSVGHPGMVRFGLDVFMKTVDGWFLPDGGTPESWAYALMTLGGIESLGTAFRGYSDPPGYADAEGKRIEKMDLYHDTAYKKVWAAMFNGLQGDLCYPPLADGYRTSGIGVQYAEMMANNYPEELRYLALFKALAGDDLKRSSSRHAIYYREPGLETKQAPPLTLPDYVFPILQIGYLRSGDAGRDSALILSASDWGGHHHLDSLSLYYWQRGREMLSDLGYLWDHPMSAMTRRTFAHNTVLVDEADQVTKGRGGKFTLFHTAGRIKVMEAESTAYAQARLYRRTIAQIERAPGRQYVVDIFRAQGGDRHNYVFHGPNNDLQVDGPALGPSSQEGATVRACLRFHLAHPGSEIYVADVSIAGPDGQNLMKNPSAVDLNLETKTPLGWQMYHGDGKGEWGQSPEGHGDRACAFLKAVERGKEGMNVALIAGDSDGYTGAKAIELRVGQTYRVRFWMRGRAPAVGVNVVYWPNDPTSAKDRHNTDLEGLPTVVPKAEWTEHTATFKIPSAMDLQNVRASAEVAAWKLTWKMDKEMSFAALWRGEPGETFLLGDGWGQRDYRNSDVGATLPYILRRRVAGPQANVFVTVFEGFAPGQAVVKGIRRLAVPEPEKDDTVALAVETDKGTDVVVSCMGARPLKLDTPVGPVEMNGRFAALSIQDGKPAASALVAGSLLRWNGATLTETGAEKR